MSNAEQRATITLEAFRDLRPTRPGRHIVRCECGHTSCQGWAEVDADTPWGLRPWEADPSTAGPLQTDIPPQPTEDTLSARRG